MNEPQYTHTIVRIKKLIHFNAVSLQTGASLAMQIQRQPNVFTFSRFSPSKSLIVSVLDVLFFVHNIWFELKSVFFTLISQFRQ